MNYYSNFELHDYHVEKDYANDAEGAEYLLEDIENEFENPDDIDWSIEAIIEYTKRQYDSANPNEAKINELITRWLERISDKPEEIEKRKIQTKKLADKIKREFDNCDESQYSSEISHIQDKKIKINTKDKAFADEVRKFIKEAIKKL